MIRILSFDSIIIMFISTKSIFYKLATFAKVKFSKGKFGICRNYFFTFYFKSNIPVQQSELLVPFQYIVAK